MSKPNPDEQRMLYGLVVLFVLTVLAARIAFTGTVEEETSYGLMPIVTALATLAGSFAQWAFGPPREPPKPPSEEP